jgi:geranylgeranyl diphosphate synthase, type I
MMDLNGYILVKRTQTLELFTDYIKSKQKEFLPINDLSTTALSLIHTYLPSGKMMRAVLVYMGNEINGSASTLNTAKISLSMELIQTSLLFHDDIMDNDQTRRGMDTLHINYAKKYHDHLRNSTESGKSLSMCTGDFGYFLAFDLLSHTDIDSIVKDKIISIVSSEISKVCLAQMQDVYLGDSLTEPELTNIINVYRYKTGRYSIALPLVLGAILANGNDDLIDKLWNLGENLGILFQIKDDELSLFGDEKQTGKPVGNDIRSDKKTLIRHILFAGCNQAEQKKLRTIYGNANITLAQIDFVREMVNKSEINGKINQIRNNYHNLVIKDLSELLGDKLILNLINQFVEFVMTRDK